MRLGEWSYSCVSGGAILVVLVVLVVAIVLLLLAVITLIKPKQEIFLNNLTDLSQHYTGQFSE